MPRCLECYQPYTQQYPEQRLCRPCSDWISGHEEGKQNGGLNHNPANSDSGILYGKERGVR